ncbi:MAG: sensor histidine kinase [Chthoniobacteraceae bacterium]|nr:sensor histidine kinase [Chthoniobacteraceae bacterium]
MESNNPADAGFIARTDTGEPAVNLRERELLTEALIRCARAEKELRIIQRRTEQSIQGLRDYAILSLDPQGNVVTWNEGAEQIFGYVPNEVIGRHVRILYTVDECKANQPEEELHLATEQKRFERESWKVRRNGSRFWAEKTLMALHGIDGELLGFTEIVRDITERKEREDALRTSEERHRRIVEDVEEYAFFMIDKEGRFATWNRGVARMLGYTKSEFAGQANAILFTPEERASGAGSEELVRAARDGQTCEERLIPRKDGSQFWAIVRLSVIHDASGNVSGFSKLIRDTTEQRRTQEALTLARRELEQRVIERTMELSNAIDLLEQQVIEREHLESALLDATENERERLGQDLHDGVCQQLTGTALLTRVMFNSLSQRAAPEAPQAKKIIELISSAVDQARALAKGLHPVSIHSTKGLIAALEELASRASESVACQLVCRTHIELRAWVALLLYRMAQDAVRNAL